MIGGHLKFTSKNNFDDGRGFQQLKISINKTLMDTKLQTDRLECFVNVSGMKLISFSGIWCRKNHGK